MKVLDLLQTMEQHLLGESFSNSFAQFYDTNEVCASIEKEYIQSMKWIKTDFSEAKKDVISEIEHLSAKNRDYASNYGFKCGIVGAFKQFYTQNEDMDGGFQQLLCNDLMKQPNMQRHQDYYARECRCNDLIQELSGTLDNSEHCHILAVTSAWEHRIYHAAVYGFYCGYHAAYHAIECVEPLSKMKHIGKILSMEFALGFLNPCTTRKQDEDTYVA